MEDNFWAAGETGPCGSDTEIFYWRSEEEVPTKFDPEDERWVEIWNNVFMEFNRDETGKITPLPKKNVDTGMGYERIVSVMEGVNDNYESSIWKDVIELLESITKLPYKENQKSMRIIADHLRTSVFIAADPSGITPSNTDQGYILRRLIRRAIRHAKKLNIDIDGNWEELIASKIIEKYQDYYHELKDNQDNILKVLKDEKIKFNKTLEKGLKEFEKIITKSSFIDGTTAFHLYDTYGFPIELTIELANERNIKVDENGFQEKMKEHQEKSRTASKGKFKGGLSGDSETETKYHTATHLLNAALKVVLGPDTHQRGSNITEERMRFDFNCDHKLTDEEKTKVEDLVNQWIKDSLEVTKQEMTKQEALALKAEAMFIDKYPEILNVYFIGDISKEICGGPHVKNTSELGHFKIKKEEASSAGVRRIKAILD